MTRFLSFFSMLIASTLVLLKFQLDFVTYEAFEFMAADPENNPRMFADLIKTTIVYLLVMICSFTICIIGIKKQNHLMWAALFLNLLTLIYLLIPVGYLLAVN